MPLSSGDRLGPFEIVSSIGKGGMGEVWKARDPRLGRDVAIKVSDHQFTDRFEREARAIAALNHSNICTLHDIGTNYLVMELIEGPTLADRIRQGALPLDEALPIARQIADALEAAHDKGIVHRDLKPANVKIRPDGSVKVLDFGLAKAGEDANFTADSRTVLSIPGMILGTAAYMSPEQARGQQVDRRADIWAFGAVLYEMLTGRVLFQGETVSDIMVEVLAKEPELGALPANIRPIVERCLRKDPRKRWQAIGDARIALDEAEAAPAQLAGNVVEVKGSLIPWAVAAALFLVAAAASLIAARATRSTSASADAPLMRFDADIGQDAVMGTAYSSSFTTISPDGARLVYAARGPNGKQMLAVRLLSQPGGTLLSGTEDGFDPFFSPDGQWIGFFAGGKLKKTSVNGSAPVTLCGADVPRGASWGEDGTIVAALTNTDGLFRVPASGGEPQRLTKTGGGESTHRWPQVLPGGQSVLFTSSHSLSNYESANIEVLDYKSGQRTVIQQGGYFGRYLASGHVVYVHEGVLFALPVAGSPLKAQGAPLPVLQDVASITTSGAGQFDISRNGVFVYRSGKAGPQVWSLFTLEASAGGSSKATPMLAKPAAYYTPRYSPDGKRLALGIESGNGVDISVYDFQNDVLSRLTFTGQVSFDPVWTPDGRHIAFYSRTGKNVSIGWVRSDGAGGVQTLIAGNAVTPYSFSPDGRRLAYYDENPQSRFETWILPLDLTDPDHPRAGKPEQFAPSQANQLHPALSPDGRWMAYTSDESGSLGEVYVRPFPETTAGGKWQISSGGGRMPFWSRDGKNLFFETLDNRIAVTGYSAKGETFLPGKPVVWSDKQIFAPTNDENFDVSPDGRKIAAIMQLSGESGASVHVTFLLNFFDELRRRVPVSK
jgi:Tol biopolymer transport system component/tRNA A-37 threonylcarbamoyl transferase component Bud32